MKKGRAVGRWLIAASAIVFAYFGYLYLSLPDVRALKTGIPKTTAFMELRAREARAAGRAVRREFRWVPLKQIAPTLTRAVIVAEDAAFWGHEGIDFDELQASVERNLEERQFVRGASTITQQLAKNLYLSPSRNPLRKVRELLIARRLEAELTKARILELYLNVIEWGDGVYGIEAAARKYLGKPASALNATESALLAGAIVNPRVLNPARPNARLLARQRLILTRLRQVGVPTDDSHRAAEAARKPAEPSTSTAESATPTKVEPEADPLVPLDESLGLSVPPTDIP